MSPILALEKLRYGDDVATLRHMRVDRIEPVVHVPCDDAGARAVVKGTADGKVNDEREVT